MIVRKPYAFLIKNFRLIHGLIFLMLTYILIKSVSIYTFFNKYAVNHFFTNTATLVSDHVDFFMLVITILIVILVSAIYFLLLFKKKNRKIYFFMIVYYLISFAYFIYIMNVFINLQDSFLDVETVRVIRDISIISIIPQIIFVFIFIARALGFNLRQFEFKKDLEDLHIDVSDYEEVEITLGENNYKYIRFFRKTLREIKYFINENKFFVTIILSILVFSMSVIIYLNIKVTNIKYEINQSVYANTMWYKVKEVYITSKSINGSIINNNKKYIIVKVEIDNKSNKKYDLSRELFRLEVDGKNLIPIYNMDQEFLDFGKIYSPMTIDVGFKEEVFVIFEIDNEKEKNEYIFKINNLENLITADTQYKDIIINPKNIDISINNYEYELLNEIKFDNTTLGSTTLTFKSYNIAHSFKDKYLFCLKNNCYEKTFTINPNNSRRMILKLECVMNLDKDAYMSKYIKNESDLFKYYGKIKYEYLTREYEEKIVIAKTEHMNNNIVYLDVPSVLEKSDNIRITFNLRDKINTINLK